MDATFLGELQRGLTQAQNDFARRFPGEAGVRQPVSVLYGGAQGAFWGALSGTRDGAWIGAAVGAGVGLVLGVVQGVEAARQTRAQLAYAPRRCPREAVAAVIPPAKEEHARETDPHTP